MSQPSAKSLPHPPRPRQPLFSRPVFHTMENFLEVFSHFWRFFPQYGKLFFPRYGKLFADFSTVWKTGPDQIRRIHSGERKRADSASAAASQAASVSRRSHASPHSAASRRAIAASSSAARCPAPRAAAATPGTAPFRQSAGSPRPGSSPPPSGCPAPPAAKHRPPPPRGGGGRSGSHSRASRPARAAPPAAPHAAAGRSPWAAVRPPPETRTKTSNRPDAARCPRPSAAACRPFPILRRQRPLHFADPLRVAERRPHPRHRKNRRQTPAGFAIAPASRPAPSARRHRAADSRRMHGIHSHNGE
jgi:hypothetical protein